MDDLRAACALIAARARHVHIEHDAIADYASTLAMDVSHSVTAEQSQDDSRPRSDLETRAAYWLTLDAINFGSGWFPTLRKRDGRSGYNTIAAAWRERFDTDTDTGPPTAAELATIDAATVATALGQDAHHELMALYARSLNDLGAHVVAEYAGSFTALARSTDGSAVALARRLGAWPCFADTSSYGELQVPFLKRAQIAAADLKRAGVVRFSDSDRLTMFADNLVPHVLRLDGVLSYEPALLVRIEREELIEHGSAEEVELRACAVHAVELIVAAHGSTTAADIDEVLWNRGQRPSYKARPRHRSRCTAY